ncbi:hypothetical protein BOX15_Mlig023487g2, partial [Macrostomum lignano]
VAPMQTEEEIQDGPWSLKDDEEQRRNRRRSHAADLLSAASGGASRLAGAEGNKENAPNKGALHGMSAKQLTEHYEDCIKLSAEGKISAKNAFALHLIDYLDGMVKQENFGGFQVASSSLDAGAKIYAGRVDAVHHEAYKVLGGLGRSTTSAEKKSNDNDINSDDDGGNAGEADDDDDRPMSGNRRKAAAERKRRQKAVIASNLARIRLKPASLRFDVDPLFQQQASAYDDGGTGELRLNNVYVVDNACEILLDSDASVCIGACESANQDESSSSNKQQCRLEDVDISNRLATVANRLDSSVLQEEDEDEANNQWLCFAFRRFSFLRRNCGGLNDLTFGGGAADQSAVLADFVARLPPPEDDDYPEQPPADHLDADDDHHGGFIDECTMDAGVGMQIDMCGERNAVVVNTADSKLAGESFHPNASRNFVEAIRDLLSDRYAHLSANGAASGGSGVGGGRLTGGEFFRLFADPANWKRKKCKLTALLSKAAAAAEKIKDGAIAGAACSAAAPAASTARRRQAAKAAMDQLLTDSPADWRKKLALSRSGLKLSDTVISRHMQSEFNLPHVIAPVQSGVVGDFAGRCVRQNLLNLIADNRHCFQSASSDADAKNQSQINDSLLSVGQADDNENVDPAIAHDLDDDADLNNFGDDNAAAYDADQQQDPVGGLTAVDQPFADAFTQAVGQATQLPLSQVPGSQQLQPMQAPYKVNQLDIAYAKTAKRINISRLKRSMWQLLETDGGPASAVTAMEVCSQDDSSTRRNSQEDDEIVGNNDANNEALFNGERSFARLLQQLPPKVGATTAQDLSVSIVFSCLLYLANEKTLHLTSSENLSDMSINTACQNTKSISEWL